MGKLFKLTTKKNVFSGTSTSDTFSAPAVTIGGNKVGTLSNSDILNGRGGTDVLKAFISADSLTPRLTSIEKAYFTRIDTDLLNLNLAKATSLSSIGMTNFASDVTMANAFALKSLVLTAPAKNSTVTLSGMDATKTKTLAISATNTSGDGVTVGIDTKVGTVLDKLTVTANNARLMMSDLQDVKSLVFNGLNNFGDDGIDTSSGSNNETLKSVTVSGKDVGNLALWKHTGIETVNGAGVTGSARYALQSDDLVSFTGGSGTDDVVLNALGGTSAAKASVNLGSGNDTLSLASGANADPARHVLDGGDGIDALWLQAPATGMVIADLAKNFEALGLLDFAGSIDIGGTSIDYVLFKTPTGDASITGLAGDGLVYFMTDAIHKISLSGSGAKLQFMLSGDFQTLGSAVDGLNVSGYNALSINNETVGAGFNLSTVYLGDLGTASSLTITGNVAVELKAAGNAKGDLSTITVTNNGGVNMAGLFSKDMFAASGVTVSGGDGDDTIASGSGSNILTGGAGLDTFYCGTGSNTVTGGNGQDVFYLNTGLDTLKFDAVTDSTFAASDVALSFDASLLLLPGGIKVAKDHIDVSAFAHDMLWLGNFADKATGEMFMDAGTMHAFYNQDLDMLYIDTDKSGTLDSSDFALKLSGVTALDEANFILA